MHLKPQGIYGDTITTGKYHSKEQLFILNCNVNLLETNIDKCFTAQETGSN